MSDYTLTKRELTALKAKLTRAKGSPRRVVSICNEAFSLFEEKGFPDKWHMFERAREDAILEIQRADWS